MALALSSPPTANYQETTIKALLQAGALSFDGPFTLKSGRQSPYFCNCGKLTSGAAMTRAGEALAYAVQNSGVEFDVLFGPAYKGIPFVTAAAIGLNTLFGKDVDYAFNRKEAKDHGEGGTLVGASLKGRKVFIIDDVITSGKAVRESIDIILKEGGEVVGVGVILDREEIGTGSNLSAVQQVEKDFGITVASAVKCRDLLQYVKGREDFKNVATAMETYREQYGIRV